MTTLMTTVEKWEDRYLDQLKQVEEPVLQFAGRASERLARFVPERPAFMADLPMLGDVVESQLKFRKRLVDEQLRFTRKLLKAMDPVVVRLDATPKRPVEQVSVTTLRPAKATRRSTRKTA